MVISNKLIGNERQYWLSEEMVTFLIIINLHYHEKINMDRKVALLSSLKKGTLLRKVNTYHCKINDKWYNDEKMYDILNHVYDSMCPKTEMPLDVFLKYANGYLNMNKNYCIDWLYFEMIQPMIDKNEFEGLHWALRSFNVDGIDDALKLSNDANSRDYHCDYCGCGGHEYDHIRDYKNSNQKKRVERIFKDYLFGQKTSSALRNPNEKLKAE